LLNAKTKIKKWIKNNSADDSCDNCIFDVHVCGARRRHNGCHTIKTLTGLQQMLQMHFGRSLNYPADCMDTAFFSITAWSKKYGHLGPIRNIVNIFFV